MERVAEIAEKTPKGKLLATLAAHHLAEEREREKAATRPPASKTPALDAWAARKPAAPILPPNTMTMAAFNKFTPSQKMAYCKRGGKLVP